MARKAVIYLIFASVLGLLLAGTYVGLERFLHDRESALEYLRRPLLERSRRTVNTLTPEKLKQIQRTGTDPMNRAGGTGTAATEAGQAAIQRQMKTLEEINRINEMNRRLMEQQRRMQNK